MDKKHLNLLLTDFAHDLVNHCVEAKNGEAVLPESGLMSLVEAYVDKYAIKAESKSIFKFPKWFSEEDYADDPILWAITEEFVQQEAESEIDRRLTDLELHRFFHCWFDDQEVDWERMEMVREAINRSTDVSEDWSELDKTFLSEKYKSGGPDRA